MIKRKRYSEEFKKSIAFEIAFGRSTIAQLSKREGISGYTLSKWRDEFANPDGGITSNKEREVFELRKKNAELEAALGEMALQLYVQKKFQAYLGEQRKKESSSGAVSPLKSESRKDARSRE